jgi:hypothetical protein
MKKILGYTAIILSVVSILFLNCTKIVAGGTEVGNPAVVGVLYQADGKIPAKGAKVYLVPTDHNPRQGLAKALAAAPESTVTNDSGVYKMDSVPAGTYNVLAAGSGNLAYQDSITVKTDTQTQVPPDTLNAPGGLRGLIRLQPGDDARTVFLLFMGTNTWGTPDDSTGTFRITNMAEGTYRVRILTTLDAYVPKDTVLSVTAGKVDSLTHDIVLQYTGIPVVGGLKIRYDTLKQIVTLTWNKPTTGRKVAGYNIYRKYQDSSLVKIKSDVKDTVFRDSSGLQDITYEYRIAAVDTQGTEGVKNVGFTVKILPAYGFARRFTYPDSTAITPYDIEKDKYGNIFVLDKYTGLKTKAVKFDSNYVQDTAWGGKIYDGEPDLTVDSLNRILIINPTKSQIDIYSSGGAFLDSIRNAGVFSNGINTGGKMDVANGSIFVLGVNNEMKIFNYSGVVIDSLSLPYYGYFRISSAGSIFMAFGHEILQITNGNIVNRWGQQGSRIGEFQFARQLCMDSNQHLFVVDERNIRIQAFDLSGAFYLRFSTPGFDNAASTSYPQGICVTSSNKVLVGQDSFVLVFTRQ